MSRSPEATNKGHLVLLNKDIEDIGYEYKKIDIVLSYTQRFISAYNHTVSIYSQVVYHLILFGTLAILAFLVFGHTSMFLGSCFP